MKAFGKTVLLISHDRDEVFRMADSIAIMDDGHLEAAGSKYDVFIDPKTVNGARLTGCKNIAACEPCGADEPDREGGKACSCVFIPSWGLKLETGRDTSMARHTGIRLHDVHIWTPSVRENPEERLSAIPESVLQEPDLTALGTEAKDIQEDHREPVNRYHCVVVEEIENPFSFTIMLRTEEGSEAFGMELNKQKWDAVRRSELDVYIPAKAVLLLE